MKCGICGEELESGASFCSCCGHRVVVKPETTGILLSNLNLMYLYVGEPTIGINKATGFLKIYDDRIEMNKIMGSTLLAGVVSIVKARQDPILTWYYRDMREAHVGRYTGIFNTIVIEMKDGKKYSFLSSSPAPNKIKGAVNLIVSQLKKLSDNDR